MDGWMDGREGEEKRMAFWVGRSNSLWCLTLTLPFLYPEVCVSFRVFRRDEEKDEWKDNFCVESFGIEGRRRRRRNYGLFMLLV